MKQVNHFSHRHPLKLLEAEQNDDVLCSGCELDLLGSSSAYACTKANCNFFLHGSCFELPRQIRHKSHPKHPLFLLPSPSYPNGEFTCNACGDSGTGFTFHCSTCKFDLHVECASLPEIEDVKDHDHPLTLLFGFPHDGGVDDDREEGFACDICRFRVDTRRWVYYCVACNYGTHLECASEDNHA